MPPWAKGKIPPMDSMDQEVDETMGKGALLVDHQVQVKIAKLASLKEQSLKSRQGSTGP